MCANRCEEVLVGTNYTIFGQARDLARRLQAYERKSHENLQNHPKLTEDGSIILVENENRGPHINEKNEDESIEGYNSQSIKFFEGYSDVFQIKDFKNIYLCILESI